MTEKFSPAARLDSFRHALRGLGTLLREQHNTRIHLLATLLVIALGFGLGVSRYDWGLLLIAIALVWLAEALNTALEYLCDAAVPQQNELIGKAKDVAAAGVLFVAAIAAVIGALVFLPYL